MQAVILAAGMGNRFGTTLPKSLNALSNGQPILVRLVDEIARSLRPSRIWIVIGYQPELIMRARPDCAFVYNPRFAEENTAKSLLRALRGIDDDVVMSNGDVVLRNGLLEALAHVESSAMLVRETTVGDEEIKYSVDGAGFISAVSKQVRPALGEAIGVNRIRREDLPVIRQKLESCAEKDYFERGFELSIGEGVRFAPVKVAPNACIEVDFPEDFVQANKLLQEWGEPTV
jgi:L-glutamine-phosphate cytidylyltransferase